MFFDTHAHLDYPAFADDFADVLARAQAAGITRIIAIGTDFDSSRRVMKLAKDYECIYAAVGWHPSYVMAAPADVRPTLRELAQDPKVVAIGETGLDYYRLPSTQRKDQTAADDARYQARQAELFQQHLEIAAELGLNCVIHERSAFDDVVKLLQPFADRVRGVFHCFAGDITALHRVLALGSLVSFTGILTFKNGQNVRDTLAATPLDRFMLETDCPYLAPLPYRGKRCEPAYVKEIATLAAQLKGCSLADLSEVTGATARGFFRGLR